jgi:hypothetical protein
MTTKIEQLRSILGDETFSLELRTACKAALSGLELPEPVAPVAPPTEPEPTPLTPEQQSAVNLQKMKDAFSQLGRAQAVTADNQDELFKTCSTCFARQVITNSVCELCADSPASWLAPSALDAEQVMFSAKASSLVTSDEIKKAMRSPWAGSPPRDAFLALHLKLREKAERPTRQAEGVPEECNLPTQLQIDRSISFYELQIERLTKEIADSATKEGL